MGVNLYQMAVYSVPVVFSGIAVTGPGLAVFMNSLEDRVAYTISESGITRNPILPPPSIICVDVAL